MLQTLAEFEAHVSTWTLQFDRLRDRMAEQARLPLMRRVYENYWQNHGEAPNLEQFADVFWKACQEANVAGYLERGVRARCKRALPSLVRETHLALLLKSAFQDLARVESSVELDTQKKTDFLIESLTCPVAIRLHTYTNTRRAHKFAAMEKKTPLAREDSDLHISDYRLTINRESGRVLSNDFWVYSAAQVQEVVDYLKECEHSYRCEQNKELELKP